VLKPVGQWFVLVVVDLKSVCLSGFLVLASTMFFEVANIFYFIQEVNQFLQE